MRTNHKLFENFKGVFYCGKEVVQKIHKKICTEILEEIVKMF